MTNLTDKNTTELKEMSEYTCYTNTHIEYVKDKFNTTTTELTCVNNEDEKDTKTYEVYLSRMYDPENKPKTVRYVKEELKEDIKQLIKDSKTISIKDQITDINFKNITLNMLRLAPLNCNDKEYYSKNKYQYSEDYSSMYNYMSSTVFGKRNKDKCEEYKPFYVITYYEDASVEDKLNREYTFCEPKEIEGKMYVEFRNMKIPHVEGYDTYYKENKDGSFEVARLVRTKSSYLSYLTLGLWSEKDNQHEIAKEVFGRCYECIKC